MFQDVQRYIVARSRYYCCHRKATIDLSLSFVAVNNTKMSRIAMKMEEWVNLLCFISYCCMSRDQNAGRNRSVRNNNGTFERVEEFKYLGIILTHQNSIAEEIKSKLRSGNACYHSVQNLLSSRLLSKNLKIEIYIEP